MLTSIVAFATLIAKVVSRDSHVEEVLIHPQGIRGSTARMNRLVGDLVDVASIEAGRLAVTCEVGDPIHVVTEGAG
jgi:signal transduction histidine kinase